MAQVSSNVQQNSSAASPPSPTQCLPQPLGVMSTSNRTRRGGRSDSSWLTLNTVLQAMPKAKLQVELRDDTTVTGILEEADAFMK